MIDDIFYRYDPIYMAQTLKHKKRYQQKQINKRLVRTGSALNTRYNGQQQLNNGGIAMACGTKKTGGKKPPKK